MACASACTPAVRLGGPRQAVRPSQTAARLGSVAAVSGAAAFAAATPHSTSSRRGSSSQRFAAPRLTVAAAAPGSAGTVAVAGATGLVGTALVKQLLADGFAVRVLTRNVVSARSKLPYPGLQFVAPQQWSGAVCGCTAVVNLAGGCWRGSRRLGASFRTEQGATRLHHLAVLR